MTNGRAITNVDIYDRLERLRLEITQQINDTSKAHKAELSDLRRQFETLEAGRLTRLEAKMGDFEVNQVRKDSTMQRNQAVLSTKVMIIAAIAVFLLTGLAQAFWLKIIK